MQDCLFNSSHMAATIFSVINTNDSGAGSLRQAILDANANAGNDTITFDSSLSGQTITLTSGQLAISDAIAITGLGADSLTISGNSASRIFYVSDNTSTRINVTIGGLTLTNGMLSGDNDGAAIWSLENLTISDSILVSNTSADDGGAIRNDGTLLISNSTLANNTSVGMSATSGGGAILNTGTATIQNSTISSNQARNGGGIRNDGTLTVINSTISGNSAITSGGGITNTIGNSTITSSTITNNTATNGGGVFNFEGTIPVPPGINIPISTTSTVTSSIIAGNVGNNDIGGGDGTTSGGDFVSGGNNLIGNGDGAAGFTNSVNNDIVGTAANPVNPRLGALANNGGLTQTHALLTGSPAIDAGNNPNSLTTDQRSSGFLRSQGSGTDIGAFETQPQQTSTANITDFNNDNLPDIVWRNASLGQSSIWYTNGSTRTGNSAINPAVPDASWVTVGIGDYDKDGQKDDILWRNTAQGFNSIWFMNGNTRVSATSMNAVADNNWVIRGVGDFDHSGYADDILWHNQATGQTIVWTMDGVSKTGGINFGTVATAWRPQGVGDFEGSGDLDDIVWRNFQTGQTNVWRTNGLARIGGFNFSEIVPTNWEIEGVSDLDGDSVADDLLWYNESNYNTISWFVDNRVKTSSTRIGTAAVGWDAVI